MESDAEYEQRDEQAAPAGPARSRSQSPALPSVLKPEKDFILTYETIPELWDTTNPAYSNKYKRNENLAKLLPILKKIKPHATLEDVKKKLNSIRSNYRRELKKILTSRRSGAGADEIYRPKLWYFSYLHFLRKLEQPVILKETSDLTNQGQSTTETAHVHQERSQHSRENTQERSFSSISTVPKPTSAKKKKNLNHDELLDRACQYLSEPCTQNIQQVLTNPIALEWSNTLDRLDDRQRLFAKKAINDILFEAELGNLNRDSVKINFHSPLIYGHSAPNNSTSTSPLPPPSPAIQQSLTPSPQYTGSMTYNTTQSYSPYSHLSSPNNSTSTSPLPPPSPAIQQSLTPSPQHTGPMTYNTTQNYSPYSHLSSPNNSTLTSPPPPPSPAIQQTSSPEHTASMSYNTMQNYSPYLNNSPQNNTTSTPPPPPPSSSATQQTPTPPATQSLTSPQHAASTTCNNTQNNIPYSNNSSPKNSTSTSTPLLPRPSSQQLLISAAALSSASSRNTSTIRNINTQINPYSQISSPHKSTLKPTSFSPLLATQQTLLSPISQSTQQKKKKRQSKLQQQTGFVNSSIPHNLTSLQSGSASQIILSSNHRDQQILASNEYILHIPDTPTPNSTPYANLISAFTQFQPE